MIVVTGGPGFLGSRVLPLLAGSGDLLLVPAGPVWRPPVRAVLDRGRARMASRPDWWTPAGAAALAQDLAGAEVTLVHLGYRPTQGRSPAQRLAAERALNRDGTVTLVTAVHPTRLVYASSAQVYGHAAGHGNPVTEDVPPDPVTGYGIAKAETEQVLAGWARRAGAEFTTLRLATLFGTLELVGRAVPNFIRAALAGVPATIHGPGRERSDYLDVDAAAAAVAAAARLTTGLGLVNIGSGVARTTVGVHRAVGQAVYRATGRAPVPPYHQDLPQRPHFVLDTHLARTHLGLTPRPFTEALDEEVDWFRRRGPHPSTDP